MSTTKTRNQTDTPDTSPSWAWLNCPKCDDRVAVETLAYRLGSYQCCGQEAEHVWTSSTDQATKAWINRRENATIPTRRNRRAQLASTRTAAASRG